MQLTEEQIQRYSRQVLLPQVGGVGQKRLLESSVLIAYAPGEVGSAAVAAIYLIAGGVGGIAWCPIPADEGSRVSPEAGSLAGLIGLYAPDGLPASAAALNPDAGFEVVDHFEGAAEGCDMLLVFGKGRELDEAARMAEAKGKPVLRGFRKGWVGMVSLSTERLRLEFSSPEGVEDVNLPAAPSEGVLGSMAASMVLKALLGGGASVGSTAQARFDLSRGQMEMVS